MGRHSWRRGHRYGAPLVNRSRVWRASGGELSVSFGDGTTGGYPRGPPQALVRGAPSRQMRSTRRRHTEDTPPLRLVSVTSGQRLPRIRPSLQSAGAASTKNGEKTTSARSGGWGGRDRPPPPLLVTSGVGLPGVYPVARGEPSARPTPASPPLPPTFRLPPNPPLRCQHSHACTRVTPLPHRVDPPHPPSLPTSRRAVRGRWQQQQQQPV